MGGWEGTHTFTHKPGSTICATLNDTPILQVLRGLEAPGTAYFTIFHCLCAVQAFGRSGLEAMASGCVPILPESGGANEYAQNGVNAFLIDTSDVQNALSIVDGIMNKNFDLAAMRTAAIATAQKYSIEKSSAATAQIFRSFKQTWEAKRRLRV